MRRCSLIAAIAVGLTMAAQCSAETRLSLPDQPFDLAAWKLVGTNPDQHVRPAPDHVEVSIGAEDSTQGVGFGPVAPLSGNFEIRGEYEIESLPPPTSGFGSGPTIYVTTRSAHKNTAIVGRLNRVKDGESYSAYWGQTVNGQRLHHPRLKSTTGGTKGVLALKRTGAKLEYLVGQTWDGPLQSIRTVDFGDEDVNYVRIGVDRGGDKQPVRVRWRRVLVTAGVDEARPEPQAQPLATLHVSGNAIILGTLAAAGLGVSGIWWFRRGRHLT